MNKVQRKNFTVTNPFKRGEGWTGFNPKEVDKSMYGRDGQGVNKQKKQGTALGSTPESLDERDKKFNEKFDSISNIIDAFDKSSIPAPKRASKGTTGNKGGDKGSSNNINATNLSKPISEGDDSMLNYSNTTGGNYNSSTNHSSIPSGNSTNATSYSNFTGSGNYGGFSGSGGSSSNAFGGRGAGKGRGNGGSSSTALSANGSGGSRWYGINEFSTGDILYNSNIPSGITFDPNPGFEDGHSQLYISQGSFFNHFKYDWSLPGSPRVEGSEIANYYTDVLMQDIYYSYLHQIEKVRNRELGNRFTQEKFIKYIDSVINGLQIYYCLDSIFAYDRDANQFNSGMSYLRERISPDVVSEFANLRRCLEKQVIKPEIVSFIRFMYQNFKFYDGENTSIIRISYYDMLADNVGVDHLKDPSMIRKIINQINADFSGAFSYIAGGFPQYKLFGKLPTSTTKALVNADFNTWWHNHTVSYPQPDETGTSISVINHSKYAVDENSDLYFGVFGNSLDGVIHAASSAWLAAKDDVQTGIWRPLLRKEEFKDESILNAGSLKFYKPESTSAKFVSTCTDVSSALNAHLYNTVTYDFDTSGENPVVRVNEIKHIPVGIHRVLAHSIRMMKQSVFEGVRFLIHP